MTLVGARGLRLDYASDEAIEVGYVRNLDDLLEVIDDVAPEGSTLYVEGRPAEQIRAFLAGHPAPSAPRIWRGTLLPKPQRFHMPLRGDNLLRLRAIAGGLAEPEVCDHIVVYDGEGVLVSAYDAGLGRVVVSRRLGDAAIERFQRLGKA